MFKKLFAVMSIVSLMMAVAVSTSAATFTPLPLMDESTTNYVGQFASSVQPAVLTLLGILIPAGLALWALGFGIKKGIAFVRKSASKAV